MSGPITWGVLALPVALAGGMFCPAVASAYARRIDAGSTVDVTALAHAMADALRRRPGEPSGGPSRWLAAGCAVALALACLPFMLQPSMLFAARALACGVLLLLALIDARTGLLPDALTLPLLCAGLMLAWAGLGPTLQDAAIAAGTAYLLLCGLNVGFRLWRGRAGLGGGDVKLVAALGAWLGWAPLPILLLAACVAGLMFAVSGAGGRSWRAPLAFGPFLAGAGALGLVGDPVVQFLF